MDDGALQFQLVITSASIAAVVGALAGFWTARATLKFERRKVRYSQIASKLDACWDELNSIGPANHGRMTLAIKREDLEQIRRILDKESTRSEAIWNVYQKYGLYLKKESRISLDEIASKIGDLKVQARLKVVKGGTPDTDYIDSTLMKNMELSFEFESTYKSLIRRELADYNDDL